VITPRRWRGKTRVTTGLVTAAIAGGAVLTAVLPASPAVAFFSPPLLLQIQTNSPATLVAKGAGADVTLVVECAGAKTASVQVKLTESVGNKIAQGFGFTTIGCTDANETIVVLVTANSEKAFAKGSAIADSTIFACTPSGSVCGSEQDQRTIKLK
jgi:hypothetical protein